MDLHKIDRGMSMSNDLNKDSKVECETHGLNPPAFVCAHIASNVSEGFFEPDEESDSDWESEENFKIAWCDRCDEILMKEGEWNDTSESFAQFTLICEGCFNVLKYKQQG